MKRIAPLLLSSVFLFSAAAHAQSSVTLYGIVDSGLSYVHNVKDSSGTNQSSQFKYSSSNLQGSRWGLKGTEELGSGLAAIFQIEDGFNVGTGALGNGGREFGRQSYVGLTTNVAGTLTLGRQYDPLVDYIQPLTGDSRFSGFFGTPGDLDNYDNTLRVSNAVKYQSPSFGGFQIEGLYALGGVAGSTGEGQTYALAARYLGPAISVAAGYFYADGGRTTTGGIRAWTSSSDSLFGNNVTQGFASARSIRIARIGVQYTLGSLAAGVSYSNTQYGRDSLSAFNQTAKFNNGAVFANYYLTPALHFGVGYNYTKLTGPALANYNQFDFGTDYSLSKRTDVYLVGVYQKANGKTLGASGKVTAALAAIGSYGANSGADTQGLAVVGIRHKF